MAERQRRNRVQFKIGVYAVLAAHLMLVLGLLIQGCKSDDVAGASAAKDSDGLIASQSSQPEVANSQPNSKPAAVAPPDAPAPAPLAKPIPDLPPAAPAAAIPAETAVGNVDLSYVVKSGDTVTRIAKAHGITVQALRAANNLNGNRLAVGQKLKLPAGARMTVASADHN